MHILALSDAAICIGQRNYMRASGQIFEEFCLTSCPKHIVFMEELKEIYERMTFLRQKGIKMKDMAERAGFSPSVLSKRHQDEGHGGAGRFLAQRLVRYLLDGASRLFQEP